MYGVPACPQAGCRALLPLPSSERFTTGAATPAGTNPTAARAAASASLRMRAFLSSARNGDGPHALLPPVTCLARSRSSAALAPYERCALRALVQNDTSIRVD